MKISVRAGIMSTVAALAAIGFTADIPRGMPLASSGPPVVAGAGSVSHALLAPRWRAEHRQAAGQAPTHTERAKGGDAHAPVPSQPYRSESSTSATAGLAAGERPARAAVTGGAAREGTSGRDTSALDSRKPPIWRRWAEQGKWDRLTADTVKAARYSAALWGTSYDDLIACVRSEGGHGSRDPHPGWVRLGVLWFPVGADGEIGPAQILDPGHWMGQRAAQRLQERSSPLPEPPLKSVRNRWSVLGQLVVLGWGFTSGYRSHWHGVDC